MLISWKKVAFLVSLGHLEMLMYKSSFLKRDERVRLKLSLKKTESIPRKFWSLKVCWYCQTMKCRGGPGAWGITTTKRRRSQLQFFIDIDHLVMMNWFWKGFGIEKSRQIHNNKKVTFLLSFWHIIVLQHCWNSMSS